MHGFEVHSNERACRQSGRLGLEQIYRVVTSGACTLKLATPQTMEVILDAVRSSAPVLWIPGHLIMLDRESTTPGNYDVAVRSPQGNSPVLIGGTTVSPYCTIRGS